VSAGLCKRCLVQLAYAIGVPAPLSIFIDSYGCGADGKTDQDLLAVIRANFDCRAGVLVRELDMLKPNCNKTACYGHFGNAVRAVDPDFIWEVPKKLKF